MTVADVLEGRAPWHIVRGDAATALASVPSGSVQCVVTSPPYWGRRDYGASEQLGVEATPEAYVESLLRVARQLRRVLRDDGTLWLNLGDSYTSGGRTSRASDQKNAARAMQVRPATPPGLKPKDLVGIPWRAALALQRDGWWLRADVIWEKPAATPESVKDRPSRVHEYVFLLTKGERYFYDSFALREPLAERSAGRYRYPFGGTKNRALVAGPGVRTRLLGYRSPTPSRNVRSVWTIPRSAYRGAHFATFPAELARRCVVAGTSAQGACARCGAPWTRVVERLRTVDGEPRPELGSMRSPSIAVPSTAQGIGHWRFGVQTTERGWEPTCACGSSDVRPCVVLDPFAGSGTTAVVALREGRRFLGVELNEAYVELAAERIREAA